MKGRDDCSRGLRSGECQHLFKAGVSIIELFDACSLIICPWVFFAGFVIVTWGDGVVYQWTDGNSWALPTSRRAIWGLVDGAGAVCRT